MKASNTNEVKNRRSFLRGSLATGAAASAGILVSGLPAFGDERGEGSGRLTKGDAAMLRFAAAAEILETDFWVQYNELGGIQDREVPGGTGNPAYTAALEVLDSDFPQYVHDNTDDEISHFKFLNAYLASKGADPVDLERFRTLPGSMATGSSGKPRLTNLMQLTLDTSWWTRYRSSTNNPDLDPKLRISPSSAGFVQGPVSGNPQNRCRPQPSGPSSSDRQHGGLPHADDRTRRQQPLPCDGAESQQRGSVANPDQHRSH